LALMLSRKSITERSPNAEFEQPAMQHRTAIHVKPMVSVLTTEQGHDGHRRNNGQHNARLRRPTRAICRWAPPTATSTAVCAMRACRRAVVQCWPVDVHSMPTVHRSVAVCYFRPPLCSHSQNTEYPTRLFTKYKAEKTAHTMVHQILLLFLATNTGENRHPINDTISGGVYDLQRRLLGILFNGLRRHLMINTQLHPRV
jgi:hypothetical protein